MKGLQKIYQSGWWFKRQTIHALRGVSLEAHRGDVFGLLGPNGAGKTTLIKALLGIIQPSGGHAKLFGMSVRSSAARRRVGYLPESLRIDSHHSATTALRYYGRLSGMNRETIARRQSDLLQLVGLEKRANESVRRFSKGMYQRLGLAQALMHDPDLLILDEPTDGLDPVGRTEVRKVIERLRDSGKTIFLNSHILQEVEMVCSRVAVMAAGSIRGLGTIDELRGQRADGKRRVDATIVVGGSPFEVGNDKPTDDLRKHLVADGFEVQESDGTDPGFRTLMTTLPSGMNHSGMNHSGMNHSGVNHCGVLVKEQNEIDRFVDWLRQREVSILDLRVHQSTLEETFLRLVSPTVEATGEGSDQVDAPENLT